MVLLQKIKDISCGIVDVLLPRKCLICGCPSAKYYNNLCGSCLSAIPWIFGQRCIFCSCPMGDVGASEQAICSNCKNQPFPYLDRIACWLHTGIGRNIILALKYHKADFLQRDITRLICDFRQDIVEFVRDAVIVPVPVSYLRYLQRGYNQAMVIARAICRATYGSSVMKLLSSKYKRSQTFFNHDKRIKNVQGIFAANSLCQWISRDRRIILVDDVATTGATVIECCNVLKKLGFNDLHVLTLSYG